MNVLRLGIGLAQSMSGPPTYSLITDFFPPRYRVKAFFAFSIMQQIGDTMQYLTSNLITAMGWRNTYFVIGIYAMAMGLTCIIFVKEPPRSSNESNEDDHSSDKELVATEIVPTRSEYTIKSNLRGNSFKSKRS
jgi:sugar phosphate permease